MATNPPPEVHEGKDGPREYTKLINWLRRQFPLSFSSVTGGAGVATWDVNATRWFACDLNNGVDDDPVGHPGWSDTSQLDAGAKAVKTLAKLMQIIPKFGADRTARAAIAAGNYASDARLDVSGYIGYRSLILIGTDTVTSAGATAFKGDTNDTACAGMTTATGMNGAGYNITAISTSGGTVTLTLQLNGGGSPGFTADNGSRPYGCRLRSDIGNTGTPGNSSCSIVRVLSANQVIVGQNIVITQAVRDIFYIEMPHVTGPTEAILCWSGGTGRPTPSVQLCGLSLGAIKVDESFVRYSGCEATSVVGGANASMFCSGQVFDGAFVTVGSGLRFTLAWNTKGGVHNVSDSTSTGGGTWLVDSPSSLTWERNGAGAQVIVYGGTGQSGNNIASTIGTNSSTAHGADCQIWGTIAPIQGTQRCGLWLGGGSYVGRVKFSNMGANPCVKVSGAGVPVAIQGATGSIADGNTDVGLDLTPLGLSGNTIGAMGCTVALVGSPSATGTAGDIRLADGTIVTWASFLGASGTYNTPEGNRVIV